MDLKNLRTDYTKNQLDISSVHENPFVQFESWFREAEKKKIPDFNAMTLSTVSENGIPSSRIVLLRQLDETGLVFFTNYNSQKSKEIIGQSVVALNFFWQPLERQVRIMGNAEKTSREESVNYFESRPRQSQIGAWTSEQSAIIKGREALESKQKQFEEKFKDQPVDCPPHWGGFRIIPTRFEFWQGRSGRLHDRIVYQKVGGAWQIERLAP